MDRVIDIIEDAKADIGCFDEALHAKWVRLAYEQNGDVNEAISYANSVLWETLKGGK